MVSYIFGTIERTRCSVSDLILAKKMMVIRQAPAESILEMLLELDDKFLNEKYLNAYMKERYWKFERLNRSG